MGRDPRDSNRERSGSNQAGERNAATRTPPRGTRAGAGDPRNGGTPPRMGASAPRRPEGRPPSDPRPGRPGNGNGNGRGNGSAGGNSGNGNGGSSRRPVAGGPDDGDSQRSGAYSATGARGPRSVPGYGDSGRAPASMPGRNGDGGGNSNGATPPRRRSMADLARDASRSMSRQLSSVVSRTGHAIRHDGPPPPQPRGPRTPPPGAMLSAETAKLSSQAYRRSRSRMVARKWRRGRVQRNPILYFATVLFAFTALLSVVAGGGAGGAYAFSYYQSHYNDVLAVTQLQSQQNSIIYDRNGTQIAVLKDDNGNLNFYAPLKQINTKVQWATIDTEDRNFYSPFNVGVDFTGTVRAALSNASGGSTQGGSTITQQLVKNIVIKDSKQTIDRKLHEAILAIGVNNSYTKEQILEFYLNSIYYHPFLYRGIEAAARYYFHLTPKPQPDGSLLLANQQLDWAQSALLAAIPNNASLFFPTQYTCDKAPCAQSKWDNPYVPGQECTNNFNVGNLLLWSGTHGHEWLAYCRALLVLGNVLQYQGDGITFTQADFDKSKAELLNMFENQRIFTFNQASSDVSQGGAAVNLAPHFVQYVAGIMQNEFGVDHLETAGLRIYTTLDLKLNQYAQSRLKYYIQQNYYNPWYSFERVCGSDSQGRPLRCPLSTESNANNGAVVAVDQHTGDILTMVGSVDYNDKDPKVAGAVNVADSLRSMGSATKPLVYATAFQMGWTPSTVLQDIPLCFPGFSKDYQAPAPTDPKFDPTAFNPTPGCDGYYTPTNYTNHNFSGRFPLRYNLGNSLNIGATETMAFVGDSAATSSDFLAMVRRLGVDTFSADRMGPTTALGTQEMPLRELVGAYATFANAGKRAPERAVLRVEDSRGNVLYNASAVPKTEQVISPQASYMLTSVLTDNDARTADFGPTNPLHFDASMGEPSGVAIAAKTGTSSGVTGPKDILTAGYSPFLTVGVWIGNDDPNDDMASGIIGVAGAGYIFHDMMLWAAQNYKWPAQAQFPVPPDMTRGIFNCATGLAPYKDQKPDSLKCTNGEATQGIPLPKGANPAPLYPDTTGYHENADWYIQGSEPVHS
jgi:membrane peptidoglycan carboxypeptidase